MFSAFVGGLIILYFEHEVLDPKGGFSYTAYFAVGWAFVIIFLKYVFIDVLWKIWLKNKNRKQNPNFKT